MAVAKNTRISLLNGQELTIEDLLQEDSKFWVYSFDKQMIPGLAIPLIDEIGIEKILKVTLNNGEVIRCSKNHLFLLRNGRYKEAKDLVINESLMPLYRKLDNKGYEIFLDHNISRWLLTHRRTVNYGERYEAEVIHHVNFNKRDNRPDNLQQMTWEVHTKLHYEGGESIKSYNKSEKGRQHLSKLMKELWSDPEWKENRLKTTGFQLMDKEKLKKMSSENGKCTVHTMHTPEARKKACVTKKEKSEIDPFYMEKQSTASRKNIQGYLDKLKSGEVQCTEKQIEARIMNGKKTMYKRFFSDKYDTFEDYLADKHPNNHKVVSVEEDGYEVVYNITVEKYNNYALSVGVFVR